MLTIEEIKKELAAGREVELECIDEEGFITSNDKRHSLTNATILGRDEIKVNTVEITGAVRLLSGRALWDSELKYFRIKRPSPTFDDLIDVVVQAIKDDVLTNKVIKISDYLIEMNINGRDRLFNSKNAEDGINFIKSLYTETFVIECEEDEMKIRQPVQSIILANGEEIINEDGLSLLQGGLCLKAGAAGNIKIPFSLLKGATVTQKRGGV